MLSTKIKSVISTVSASLLTALIMWIVSYHFTLATKADMNLMHVELRLKDVEDAIFDYSQQEENTLNPASRARYKRLQATLLRLERDYDKIVGVSDD